MKGLLRSFLVNLTSLWAVASFTPAIVLGEKIETLPLASLALTLANLVVRPILKLLFLPVTLLTLGLFQWVINVIILYLVTRVVAEFNIAGFIFAGFSWQGFIIPSFTVSLLWAFILVSFLLSLVSSFVYWLIK